MNTLLAGAFSIGVLAMTTRVAHRHAQAIDKDIQGRSSDLARMFALRESIEDFPLPLGAEFAPLRFKRSQRPSLFDLNA